MNQFRPIERHRLCTEVSKRLEEIIASHYSFGDRIPPEMVLARKFGVSRNVLREAIKILAERGLLEVRQGSGTFVSQPGLKHVSKALSRFMNGTSECTYQHIYEVRRVLEVGTAKLAALRATDEDIESMMKTLDTMEKSRNSVQQWSRSDLSFHLSLARATHNTLFGALLEPITDQLLQIYAVTYQVTGSVNNGLFHHRNIIDRITKRDPEAAGAAMLAHLEDSEQYVLSMEQTRFLHTKEVTHENHETQEWKTI